MEKIIQEIEKLKAGLSRLEQLVKDTKRKRNSESPSSSQKPRLSLREEFIAAGYSASVFDSLHGKLSEQQLRDIYKF